MKNLVKWKKGQNSYVHFVIRQVTKKNSNFIALFQGGPGTGKTWCAIALSELLDPTFNVDKQLVFDFKQLMALINDEDFKKRKTKIIIFDEPQISISNRSWQALTNKMMNFLISTFRHQNVILFFCCPYRDFLDSQSMKMLHCVFEMQSINKKEGKVIIRPKLQQYNATMRKTYEHPLYVQKNGKIVALREISIRKPKKEHIDIYEVNKTTFTSKLNREIEMKIDAETKSEDGRKKLTEHQEKAMSCLALGMTAKEGAKTMGIAEKTFGDHRRRSFKKGYKVEEFKTVKDVKNITTKS